MLLNVQIQSRMHNVNDGADSSYLGPGGIPQENDYFSRMERKARTGEVGSLGPSPWSSPSTGSAGNTGKFPSYPGNDPSKSPGANWEWRGPDKPGGDRGAWYNPTTGETLKPDLSHSAPIGKHWDYIPYKNGPQYRIYPDGTILPK